MTHPAPIAREGWYARLVRSWRASRDLGALHALEPHDRSRMLSEAGLGERDAAAVMRAGHVAGLLPAALTLHGIDGSALDASRPDLLHDLQRVCARCTDTRACRHLLAEGASRDEHGRLCPNAGTLESLR